MGAMLIESLQQVDDNIARVRASARRTADWLAAHRGDPLELLRQLKFDPVGRHPVEDRPLNVIEQVNQTWTYLAALVATRWLLAKHPKAGGFRLAPGAHAAQPLDVMSVKPDLVGAETFAAVHPNNNGKLNRDLARLERHPETKHRYVFFISPDFANAQRQRELERRGKDIQVWSFHAD